MKNLYLFFVLVFFHCGISTAQHSLNNYKYIIIPEKFDFLKEKDQYQLNSLTKFLLEKNNFQVFFDGKNLPSDLVSNRCLALYGNVQNLSQLFRTKLSFSLKDCYNNEVFATEVGSSKIKDFQKAYHEALRDAFQSFNGINYNYSPSTVQEKQHVNSVVKIEEKKDETSKETIPEEKIPKIDEFLKDTMLAKPFDLGFNVFDSDSNEVMVLLLTADENVFIVQGKDAVVSKRNDSWLYSENDGQEFLVKVIKIKFQ